MEGKLVLVLANLKSRNLVGFPSHGMVMCSSNEDHTQVQLITAPEGTPLGERVICKGFESEPATDTKIQKKKMFEKVAPFMTTNEEGVPTWKGLSEFSVSTGVCRAEGGMKGGHVG